jgi:hypothetical protein
MRCLSLLGLFAAGCFTSTDPVPPPAAETPDAGTTTPVVHCPEPKSGPTIHKGDLAGDEVWTADASPHVVEYTVTVRNGKKLTIEPCAVVQFAPKAGLSVAYPITPNQGTLIAEGTAEKPIRFEGKNGAKWHSIYVQAPGTARLSHVTIKDAGQDAPAALIAYGSSAFPLRRDLFVDHVTVENAVGLGVKVARVAGFAAGSRDLVVRGAGDMPLEIDDHGMGTLPGGTYRNNAVDSIRIEPEGSLQEDATVRDLGVPYVIGNSTGDSLRIGNGDANPLAVLTIEPGVTMKFQPGAALKIEHFTGTFPAAGALIARGTKDKPIVFTSAKPAPAAGDWVGLWYGGIPRAQNVVENVRIEYSGADCGCVLASCSAVTQYEGAVIFSQPPPSAFIRDSVIAHGKGHGFVLGYLGPQLDFVSQNAFEDLAGCRATLPSAPSCPNPKPSCL